MRKKITLVIIAILSLITLKLWIKNYLNNRFIITYNEKDYSNSYLDINSIINIYEPYIVKYNYGNYYYKTEEYEEAYKKYLETLEYRIPTDRLCKVKINTSLSLVMQVENKKNRQEQEDLLKLARSYLDDGCDYEAPEEDQDTAEELRKAIDELLNSQGGKDNDDPNENDNDDPNNDPLDDEINQITEDNNNASNQRDDNLNTSNNIDNSGNYCSTNCW